MENFNNNCKPEHTCPTFNIDGVISGGKQFDLDITLPEDNRDAIYGIVKNWDKVKKVFGIKYFPQTKMTFHKNPRFLF